MTLWLSGVTVTVRCHSDSQVTLWLSADTVAVRCTVTVRFHLSPEKPAPMETRNNNSSVWLDGARPPPTSLIMHCNSINLDPMHLAKNNPGSILSSTGCYLSWNRYHAESVSFTHRHCWNQMLMWWQLCLPYKWEVIWSVMEHLGDKINFLMKRLVDEMTGWWNDRLKKWLVNEMTGWWNDRLMKWLVDEMTGWWNDWLMKWLVNGMTG